MVFLLGPAKVLALLLCFPMLLWVLDTGFNVTEGELCHSWTYGVENLDTAFQCPQHPDDMDEKFCCGNCSAPYCCSFEEDRLDQAQCPAGQRAKRTTKNRRRRTAPAPNIPLWARIIVVILAIIFLMPITCCLIYAARYILRRIRRWRESRNRDQYPEPFSFSLPTIHIPSVFDLYPPYYEDPPPSYSEVVDPQGPWALSRTSNVPPVTQLDQDNAGYQDDEAQPSLSHPLEPALETGDPHPSRPSGSSLDPSDAEESYGARAWPSDSEGDPPPSYETVCAFDRDDRLPYSVGSQAAAAAWASATSLDNPQAQAAAQGNPQVSPVDLPDVRPRNSAVTSHTLSSEDPPPYSVAITHGRPVLPRPRRSAIASPNFPPDDPLSYRAPVSRRHQLGPCALESPPVVQFQRVTMGATEVEVITVSPQPLLDTAAADPILEPMLKASET